ncbi:hypothetical protein JAAARDRAFT_40267 [Jaapia argillacea MUCL 33604]|uniref:Uncharacterized protein n=1 Tax=Jaapia argillacea MUCL 33604 TaxID=933084 RepID=A0A067PC01_9AGAM|nr:hypothetical protein JAAARDRAFT_40267 [Jaapia argillacea MUCL 33604]
MSLIVLNPLTSNSRHATISSRSTICPSSEDLLASAPNYPLLVFTWSYSFPAQPNPGYHASASSIVALHLEAAPDYVKGAVRQEC